ncbi:hypothetical protein KI387_036132, partial [Taxus chinensis]
MPRVIGRKGTRKPISGGSEEFVPSSLGQPGREDARDAKSRQTRRPIKSRHVSQEGNVQKFKGRGFKRWPEPIGIGHVSNGTGKHGARGGVREFGKSFGQKAK